MDEITLSDDLNIITAEINSYKQVAGQAIFEIGKRLKHVKEKDLVHGEWSKYCTETLDISIMHANRYIKVYEEFGSTNITPGLGLKKLYQIATMPEEERNKEHKLQSGETKKLTEMTSRELEEVKKRLKQEQQARKKAEKDNETLGQLLTEERNKQPRVIEKEVVKEIIPEHLKKQMQEQDRFLKATKREYEQLQSELRLLKAQQSVDDVDDDLAEQKLKRLEREASIETMELAVSIRRFLKDASLTQYQIGALAAASESYKQKTLENVEILEQFIHNIKTALKGRIEI